VLVRDLTGRLTTWIEVGAPDAERLHYASKLADRTTVYTHRDPREGDSSTSTSTERR
jgi:uncharacterized protein YaeQ